MNDQSDLFSCVMSGEVTPGSQKTQVTTGCQHWLKKHPFRVRNVLFRPKSLLDCANIYHFHFFPPMFSLFPPAIQTASLR